MGRALTWLRNKNVGGFLYTLRSKFSLDFLFKYQHVRKEKWIFLPQNPL